MSFKVLFNKLNQRSFCPFKADFGIHPLILLKVYGNVRMPGKFFILGVSLSCPSKNDCQAGLLSFRVKRYLQSALPFV